MNPSPRFDTRIRWLDASGCRDGRQDQRTIVTLLNLRNLGVTLNAPLFSELNLVVNAGDRIGLVAANGRGKSTLLRWSAHDQQRGLNRLVATATTPPAAPLPDAASPAVPVNASPSPARPPERVQSPLHRQQTMPEASAAAEEEEDDEAAGPPQLAENSAPAEVPQWERGDTNGCRGTSVTASKSSGDLLLL